MKKAPPAAYTPPRTIEIGALPPTSPRQVSGSVVQSASKSLPLWGRWQPEGLTDEVASRPRKIRKNRGHLYDNTNQTPEESVGSIALEEFEVSHE